MPAGTPSRVRSETLPSGIAAAFRPSAPSRQLQVRRPCRFRTVRSSSVRPPVTVIVSCPNGVGRETPRS